jgi:hypothetical protein
VLPTADTDNPSAAGLVQSYRFLKRFGTSSPGPLGPCTTRGGGRPIAARGDHHCAHPRAIHAPIIGRASSKLATPKTLEGAIIRLAVIGTDSLGASGRAVPLALAAGTTDAVALDQLAKAGSAASLRNWSAPSPTK